MNIHPIEFFVGLTYSTVKGKDCRIYKGKKVTILMLFDNRNRKKIIIRAVAVQFTSMTT